MEVYGKLMKGDDFISDFWEFEAHGEEFYTLYVEDLAQSEGTFTAEGAEGGIAKKTAAVTGTTKITKCDGVGREIMFNKLYTQDLLTEATMTPWHTVASERVSDGDRSSITISIYYTETFLCLPKF